MKGVVFTEFLDLVEGRFGLAIVDRIMSKSCPVTQGFTTVGTYDHHQLLNMVDELGDAVQVASSDLVKAFGEHLFGRFLNSFPDAFRGIDCTFDLLKAVETVIHVEVQKLNPDAELPRFNFPEVSEGQLKVVYHSTRPFADLAEGMIQACIVHFGEAFEVNREDLPGEPGTSAVFTLAPLHDSSCSPV